MKGTVVLRYVGNRPQPEERALPSSWEELFEAPMLPEEFEKTWDSLKRAMAEALRIPVERLE